MSEPHEKPGDCGAYYSSGPSQRRKSNRGSAVGSGEEESSYTSPRKHLPLTALDHKKII